MAPFLPQNEMELDDFDYDRFLEKQYRSEQWSIVLGSLKVFVLCFFAVLLLFGLCMGVLIYVRNKEKVRSGTAGNSTGGSSPVSLDDSDLYPILNIAGDNRTTYLKYLDLQRISENGHFKLHHNRNAIIKSDKKIYTYEEMITMRDRLPPPLTIPQIPYEIFKQEQD